MDPRDCVLMSLLGYLVTSTSLIYIGCGSVAAKTIFLEENAPTIEEVNFMKMYGYLPEGASSVGETYTGQSVAEAVAKMQSFAGLTPTGYLDDETRKLFKRRRCGVKDIETKSAAQRRKRYILQQGWGKKSITYRVINGTSTLPKSRVEALMSTGLEVWAPHGGLSFRRVDSGKADIQVSFASKDHGDGFPFDGPGRVVAHAFPPPHGAMHFDDDELWGDGAADDDDDVTDFFAVAVHEIGHALGLSHSNVKASVMYPYYQVPVEKLHEDDIMGMQELYLKEDVHFAVSEGQTESIESGRSSQAPRFTKAESEEDDENDVPDLCYTNYDTIQVIQGKIYVFEEEWVWVLSERKQIVDGYPKRFHDVFIGLPKHINVIRTIYEKRNGHIVVFSGRSYWEFSARFRLVKRGRITEYKIPQVPELTTVFVSNYNNKTYLIEYERYWRYDEATRTMDKGYPKEMSAWRNVPYPVDAAIIWKEGNSNSLIENERYWRYDEAARTMDKGHPKEMSAWRNVPYPVDAAIIWKEGNCNSLIEYERYWRYDEAARTMDKGYPKEMSAWRNVPYPVDAAIIWKEGNCNSLIEYERYWRYDEAARTMDKGYPKEMSAWRNVPYPVDAAIIWKEGNCNSLIEYERYWRYDEAARTMDKGYPKEMSAWRNVPYPVDAAIIWKEGNCNSLIEYERYWRYDEAARTMDKGYPKEMSAWRNVPYPVDAAIIWKEGNCNSLIEYERYWRYDEAARTMDKGYPKEMSAWRNVPYPVDAAIIWKEGNCNSLIEYERYWRYDEAARTMDKGYPKEMSAWRNVPYPVDAAIIWKEGNCNSLIEYERYWRYDEAARTMDKGYPKEMSAWRNVPYPVDAAIIWKEGNCNSLIEYERYWRYDEAARTMDKGYPKEMSAWRNVPYPVDAAIIWKEDTYFFRGPRFWRFDNVQIRAHQYYPLPTAQIWFPCRATPDMMQYTTNDEP